MKILVTGSAGFIGFHVARALLERGVEVVGFDNFDPYYDVRLKLARHARLREFRNFTGLTGDVADWPTVEGLFQRQSFDVVCHLAAQAGVRHSVANPHAFGRSNLIGFLNILEACRHVKTKRLVYASSSSVYGGNNKLPASESDPVERPISLYAATKKANELMAHSYSHLFGIQTIGLRFFTVYGPWGRPDMAMWRFTEAMLAGKPIPVFNRGNMRRDFTYIEDIVSGVLASIFRTELAPYEIFNLGNHRSEELMELIRILSQALGKEPVLDYQPMQPGDVPASLADIRLAREKLGYEPRTPISVGVPKFVEWYLEYSANIRPATPGGEG